MLEFEKLHELLRQQLRQSYGSPDKVHEDISPLVEQVNRSYQEFDRLREQSQRSVQQVSSDLLAQNRQLQQANEELQRTHHALHEQTVLSETLWQIGQVIAAELDLQKVIQSVTDQATQATGAQFGAFFLNTGCEESPLYRIQVLSGLSAESIEPGAALARGELCSSIFSSHGIFRCGNLPEDLREVRDAGIAGMPRGFPSVQSAMAAAVVSRTGEALGGLFFGHSKPDVFGERDQRLLQGIAAQAAVAIDNARLFKAAQEAGERLAHQAQHDALTGLPNRLLFRDRVQRCIERSRRHGNYHFAVLFLDLDRFKIVNDSFGHAVGDRLLVTVAERLAESLRRGDSVSRAGIEVTMARMGGDEGEVLSLLEKQTGHIL